MIFAAPELRSRRVAAIGLQLAYAFLLAGACIVLAACNADPPAGQAQAEPDAGVDAPDTGSPEPAAGAAASAPLGSNPDCPVLESRDWTARIEAGDGDERRLHVSGEVDLPTPGYTATWSEGPADRRMPPAQHLILELAAPPGMAAQVVSRLAVDYDGAATYPEYRAILVRCGNVVLASITDIVVPD